MLVTACSSEDCVDATDSGNTEQNKVVGNEVSVSQDGYLVFPTSQSLKNFVEEISNGQQPTVLSQTTRSGGIKTFESVADLDERLARMETRTTNTNSEDLSDLEEMTEEEFNLMKAENLLFDDVLTHMVDTTLRVCVEGRLYKITEKGTFSVDTTKSEKLELTIKDFNPNVSNSIKTGQSIKLNNDVTFTKSFSDNNISDSDFQFIEDSNLTTRATSDVYTENAFHTPYNVDSYRWKNHSVAQKFLDWLRGKDVSREKKFNKNKRIQVSVFDVNYAFYASAGIKVKMQKRKKFLGVPYWNLERAEKIILGFNGLDGIMKYNNPRSYSSINPALNKQWGTFTGTLNGIQSKFFYGMYSKLPFIKDWVDDIICMMPEIKYGDNNWKDKVGNSLYNAPAKLVYQQLRSLENKYIYSPIKHQITPTDPKLAYLVWGNSATEFNKEHPYIIGVKEYNNRKYKSVIFDRAFGFSILNGFVSGFLPSDFDIKKLDVFGAAYYDKKWRGVRFYI